MPPPRPLPRCPAAFFSYETPKAVVVRSRGVGVLHRALQLLILAYFIGWVFLHEKAYQVRDTAIESSVVTKVKGVGRYAGRVLDTADYVTPPQGTSVFVVVTKQILTENQAQGLCPEGDPRYRCTADHHCQGMGTTTGSGVLTGRCVPFNRTLHTCEIQGWCPAEVDTVDVPVMLEAENFTLLIKNSVRFPLFGFEKGGCWASRSGGCATWTAAGSTACPATPSPAWMGCPPPPPPATTSGTPGTTAGRMALSAAPSPRPSASALTSWCTATLGSSASSPPSSTRWQLSPPSVWERCCATSSCSTACVGPSTTRPASSRRFQRSPCPPPASQLGHPPGTPPETRAPAPSACSTGCHGATPHLPPPTPWLTPPFPRWQWGRRDIWEHKKLPQLLLPSPPLGTLLAPPGPVLRGPGPPQ